MKKHGQILIILIFCMVFLLPDLSISSDGQDFSTSKTYLLSKIIPLAELITSDNPSLKEAVRMLGGNAKEYKKEKIVSIKASGYSAILYMEPSEKDVFVTDIEINTKLDMEIEFHRDIVPLLGKEWKEIAKYSKYPGVSFVYSNNQTGKRAKVFADLFYPPNNPQCPVQGIIIRIERPVETK